MIYARFLTFIIVTLSLQCVAIEGTCAEDEAELLANPKYIEYAQAIGQEYIVCLTDESKCDFPDSKKMCTDMSAVFYVMTTTTTCDDTSLDTIMIRAPQCYAKCTSCNAMEKLNQKGDENAVSGCTTDFDVGCPPSSASNFSLNTIAILFLGLSFHSLAEAMM
uniref:ShKT domain-containing protein n=1 Tax=Proboscia inermis TaxID=420281 RepID=A0A6T8P6Q3_9STRA|mmetsp:Transcript_5338/g.5568  ORF Transcript_5338/g.5568 Transcript_5338/m.5568 type:complete len:163 (+) Transcript_5338:149-637(+)